MYPYVHAWAISEERSEGIHKVLIPQEIEWVQRSPHHTLLAVHAMQLAYHFRQLHLHH